MFIKLLVIIIKKTERDILRFIFIGTTYKTKEKFEKKNEESKLLSYKLWFPVLEQHCCWLIVYELNESE